MMKCIFCDTEMILLDKWINPAPEPSEWSFGCPRCYARLNINQAYGEDWETGIFVEVLE